MKDEVYKYVLECDNCQQNKGEHIKLPGLLQPLPIPDEAWNSISMDFIVGLPKSEGKEVILVVVDRLTKYAHLMALKHPFKASKVAQIFLDNVYKLHGLPQTIISDRDPVFTSKFWQEIMEKLGVKLNMGTTYHPQSDGQTERVNQCIEGYLRCMLFNQPKNWCKWLPLAEFWYNTNYHTSLKTTPFQAMYGYAPPQLPLGSPPKCTVEGVNEMLKERHQWLTELRGQLKKAQDRMKKFADQKRSERSFNKGDWVYLKLQPYRQVSVKGKENLKLAPKFYGPFEILAKIGRLAYRLQLPPESQIHPIFHVSQLKKRIGDSQAVTPGIPLKHPCFENKEEPEGILGRKVMKKNNAAVPVILIKWKGKSEEDATWEEYSEIEKKFPHFILRDKDDFKKGGMSEEKGLRLATVERFDLVKASGAAEEKQKEKAALIGVEIGQQTVGVWRVTEEKRRKKEVSVWPLFSGALDLKGDGVNGGDAVNSQKKTEGLSGSSL